ncbi:MAG TPA: hypothetical protein VLO07_09890 [Thermoanaerobaculia bacterium]|nr:hypothetical protein [Thermoanaerobaculia bacterium]
MSSDTRQKILEGALYIAMLGTDLAVVLFASAPGLILALPNLWLGVLGFTLLVSIVGAIVGPWRLRGRLALWYACIAVHVFLLYGPRQERPWPVVSPLLIGIWLIGLLCACVLPVVWLIRLPRAEP